MRVRVCVRAHARFSMCVCGVYLEVRGSLEGLGADPAHVAAVLAVALLAVAPQCVGVLTHLAAVEAPVPQL